MTGKRPFEWPVRVYFEDTDAGGIVYYANYLKFMERARTEWLRALGFEQDRLREEAGILLAVSRVAVNYMRPARFNERLLASVRLLKLRRASMNLAQEVSRESSEVVCTGLVRIASLDAASLRPRAMPAAMVKEIDVAD